MKLTFIGATHEVTGSCFLLEACGKNILIDCGMEQGKDYYVNQEIPIPISSINTVLLTHAHIDHSGNLPALYAKGFRGSIHATGATCSLCDIMLQDSAHIQMFEAEWKNRKRKRSGDEPFIPAYTMEDALSTIMLFSPHDYNTKETLYPGIEYRFIDVGHLLGSSSIEIWITEDGITKKIVFSGDIGNTNKPIINDPIYITDADYVVMESTYGDRSHHAPPDYLSELSRIIQNTFDRGGNIVIPSFAVGRTQELLYFIHKIKAQHLVKGHGEFKVYVDSPLANEATAIFREHGNEYGYFDEEAMDLILHGIDPLSFPGLKTSITTEESKAINFDEDRKIIISASGMCEAGRIRHHLKHNLWDSKNTILFVGYQAAGSLGRILLDGVKEVKLFGEEISVNAEIIKLEGISGHADREGLIYWLSQFEKKPAKVFIVHGESDVCDLFAHQLRFQHGYNTTAPFSGAVYDLKENIWLTSGKEIPIENKQESHPVIEKATGSIFNRLVLAGKRLTFVIQRNQGGANRDLKKFEKEIQELCDKWDR